MKMENIKFMIRHVERLNCALNVIESLNREVKFEAPLSQSVAQKYKLELNKAAHFEYTFQMYSAQFSSSRDGNKSVLTMLKDNLNSQLAQLLRKVKYSSVETQMASIQCDLANAKAILELCEDYCYKDACYTIRNFVQTEQEYFNGMQFDLTELESSFGVFAKLKGILVCEMLCKESQNNDFAFLMEVMFEQTKLKFCEFISDGLESVVFESFAGELDYDFQTFNRLAN